MSDFLHHNRIYYSSIEFAMSHLGSTWKMPILGALRQGALRYGDLKEKIAHISHKMLHTQLRELEKKGMLTRSVYYEKPPRVEYALTEKGERALPVMDLLQAYGEYLMKEEGINLAS